MASTRAAFCMRRDGKMAVHISYPPRSRTGFL